MNYERYKLLTEVAESYYIEGKNQSEISKKVGVTRSMISRMLTEAVEKGIVKITVNRLYQEDIELQEYLQKKYDLKKSGVIIIPQDVDLVKKQNTMSFYAAQKIHTELKIGKKVGITFGTTLSSTVDALITMNPVPIIIVQFTGSLGASGIEYDTQTIVQKLSNAYKNSEAVYLHAPFEVSSLEIKDQLFENKSNHRYFKLCKTLDIMIVGAGVFEPKEFSALYRGGHIDDRKIEILKREGIVGEIGGFTINNLGEEIQSNNFIKMLPLTEKAFKKIPLRICVAYGEHKAKILLAALRGGWFSHLITDNSTAKLIIENES